MSVRQYTDTEVVVYVRLLDEGTDVWRRVERLAALVGGDTTDGLALVDGRAAGEQCHGLCRAAVVSQ